MTWQQIADWLNRVVEQSRSGDRVIARMVEEGLASNGRKYDAEKVRRAVRAWEREGGGST
jgi:hypothetical protein